MANESTWQSSTLSKLLIKLFDEQRQEGIIQSLKEKNSSRYLSLKFNILGSQDSNYRAVLCSMHKYSTLFVNALILNNEGDCKEQQIVISEDFGDFDCSDPKVLSDRVCDYISDKADLAAKESWKFERADFPDGNHYKWPFKQHYDQDEDPVRAEIIKGMELHARERFMSCFSEETRERMNISHADLTLINVMSGRYYKEVEHVDDLVREMADFGPLSRPLMANEIFRPYALANGFAHSLKELTGVTERELPFFKALAEEVYIYHPLVGVSAIHCLTDEFLQKCNDPDKCRRVIAFIQHAMVEFCEHFTKELVDFDSMIASDAMRAARSVVDILNQDNFLDSTFDGRYDLFDECSDFLFESTHLFMKCILGEDIAPYLDRFTADTTSDALFSLIRNNLVRRCGPMIYYKMFLDLIKAYEEGWEDSDVLIFMNQYKPRLFERAFPDYSPREIALHLISSESLFREAQGEITQVYWEREFDTE